MSIFNWLSHCFNGVCYFWKTDLHYFPLSLRIKPYFKSHLFLSCHRTGDSIPSFVGLIKLFEIKYIERHIYLFLVIQEEKVNTWPKEKGKVNFPASRLISVYSPAVSGCWLYIFFFFWAVSYFFRGTSRMRSYYAGGSRQQTQATSNW